MCKSLELKQTKTFLVIHFPYLVTSPCPVWWGLWWFLLPWWPACLPFPMLRKLDLMFVCAVIFFIQYSIFLFVSVVVVDKENIVAEIAIEAAKKYLKEKKQAKITNMLTVKVEGPEVDLDLTDLNTEKQKG